MSYGLYKIEFYTGAHRYEYGFDEKDVLNRIEKIKEVKTIRKASRQELLDAVERKFK